MSITRKAWCVAAIAGSFGMGTALAQDDASSNNTSSDVIDEIVITGSRIPRAGFDTLQPALVVDGEFMQERSFTDLGSALERVTGIRRSWWQFAKR